MSGRVVAIVLAGGLLVASCGGSDSAEPTVVETSSAPSSDSPSESTHAPATEPTMPATTEEPTTTLSPDDQKIADAEAALLAALAARAEALAAPSDEAARARVEQTWSEPALDLVVDQLDQLVSDGVRLEKNLVVPATNTVVGEPTSHSDSEVRFVYCRVNSDRLVTGGTGSTPLQVINDDIVTQLWEGVLRLGANGWSLAGGELIREVDGEVSCESLL